MEAKYYTVERGQQILISLLKQHGIRKVIASPGTTNITFVASVMNDPFFQVFSFFPVGTSQACQGAPLMLF